MKTATAVNVAFNDASNKTPASGFWGHVWRYLYREEGFMLLTAEQIKIEALSLPPEERPDLLLRLADSLGVSDDVAIEQEWLTVASGRLNELRLGQVVGIPAEQVFAELRARKTRT